ALAKDNAIDRIKFNQDGSLLATASRYRTNSNDEISRITIYNIISRTLLHTISHDARVRHMQFTQSSPLTLTIFSKKKINGCKFPLITHWKLHPKKPITHHSQQLQWSDEHI